MPALQIHWPRSDYPRLGTGILVASGRAAGTIVGVRGECRPSSGAGHTIAGTTFAHYLAGSPQARFYRWLTAFRIEAEGDYDLVVTGWTVAGAQVQDRTQFTIRGHRFLDIGYPQAGDDLSGVADDFVAYGDLSALPLGVVAMTDSLGNRILPDHTFGDYTDLQFWSAQFPSLAPETYTLHAEDSQGSGGDVGGLSVT